MWRRLGCWPTYFAYSMKPDGELILPPMVLSRFSQFEKRDRNIFLVCLIYEMKPLCARFEFEWTTYVVFVHEPLNKFECLGKKKTNATGS